MNQSSIYASLPSLKVHEKPAPTDAQQAEREKAARIEFHRTSVRNGPVAFKQQTNGQARRAARRAKQTEARKAFKGRVRSYFAERKEEAALRGNLQFAGILPFYDETMEPTFFQKAAGLAWIYNHYGVGEEHPSSPIRAALTRYFTLTGSNAPEASAAVILGNLEAVDFGEGVEQS